MLIFIRNAAIIRGEERAYDATLTVEPTTTIYEVIRMLEEKLYKKWLCINPTCARSNFGVPAFSDRIQALFRRGNFLQLNSTLEENSIKDCFFLDVKHRYNLSGLGDAELEMATMWVYCQKLEKLRKEWELPNYMLLQSPDWFVQDMKGCSAKDIRDEWLDMVKQKNGLQKNGVKGDDRLKTWWANRIEKKKEKYAAAHPDARTITERIEEKRRKKIEEQLRKKKEREEEIQRYNDECARAQDEGFVYEDLDGDSEDDLDGEDDDDEDEWIDWRNEEYEWNMSPDEKNFDEDGSDEDEFDGDSSVEDGCVEGGSVEDDADGDIEDGDTEDGNIEDGDIEDGAVEDGAVQDDADRDGEDSSDKADDSDEPSDDDDKMEE